MSVEYSFWLVDSSWDAHEESKNYQIKKFLRTIGHDSTTHRLIDCKRPNQLYHETDLIVDIYG